jgi:hypothetical protein
LTGPVNVTEASNSRALFEFIVTASTERASAARSVPPTDIVHTQKPREPDRTSSFYTSSESSDPPVA